MVEAFIESILLCAFHSYNMNYVHNFPMKIHFSTANNNIIHKIYLTIHIRLETNEINEFIYNIFLVCCSIYR